ncbi:jg18441 [Pararge aegeria aegeria]|uniref:Jg18441 protein n=1 Tax=Pararge aegeria aegeria TaxID=348720 RepID=A0A8S4SFT2_9NEOP|nr:jg18441 [Pararge aegeria aegeria]
MGLIKSLRVTQRAMERTMLGVSLRDRISNVEIRRSSTTNLHQSYRHSSTSREAEVAMARQIVRRKDGRWNGSPELVSAALVDPQRGGHTTLSASQVAAGSKRHRTVEFGTPYKRPMSSSGRLSIDVMTYKYEYVA